MLHPQYSRLSIISLSPLALSKIQNFPAVILLLLCRYLSVALQVFCVSDVKLQNFFFVSFPLSTYPNQSWQIVSPLNSGIARLLFLGHPP